MSTDNPVDKVIAKMAEKMYPVLHLTQNAGVNSRRNQRAYSAGAKDMKEHLGGFAEWCSWNDWEYNGIEKTWTNGDDALHRPLTTKELEEIYFSNILKNK